MEFKDLMQIAGNGSDQTSILITFAIFDLLLGLSWRIKLRRPLISNNLMSGIMHNFIPSLLPELLHILNLHSSTHSSIYPYASFVLFVAIGYFIIQSITANLNLLGLTLPDFLQNWINNELKTKMTKKD